MSHNNGESSPQGLQGLLQIGGDAKVYFDSLPDYVQQMILARRERIQSEDELRRYAETLLNGD